MRADRTQTKPDTTRTHVPLAEAPFGWKQARECVGAALIASMLGALAVVSLASLFWVVRSNETVANTFAARTGVPEAVVYTSPIHIKHGQVLESDELTDALTRIGYRETADAIPGSFTVSRPSLSEAHLSINTRPFVYLDAEQPSQRLDVHFRGRHITAITKDGARQDDAVRLDPGILGRTTVKEYRDQTSVRLENVPKHLVDTLIAVEDRSFRSHPGVDLKGVLRAAFANVQAGEVRQGASTLTQQFVRGRYLGNQRTFTRKLNEALMAVLLERHYTKDQILEGYINEIYLGQNGNRAVHGFASAAEFYFARPLETLTLDQSAMLVALVRGPSLYNPRRNPHRVLERRNMALQILAQNHADYSEASVATSGNLPLAVVETAPAPVSSPSFSTLVETQIAKSFAVAVDRRQPISIFSTLDPRIQGIAERALTRGLSEIEEANNEIEANSLEGAIVVAGVTDGRIHAVVGGRRSGYAGFNRALEAKRSIGSLIKPAIFLTALENTERYTLATKLEDYRFQIPGQKEHIWRPRNFNDREHGKVSMLRALASSYNLASARLGIDVGIASVHDMVHRLGVQTDNSPYPSILLGAIDMTPLEVAQMYQTMANAGRRIPLHAVTAVRQEEDGKILPAPVADEIITERKPAHRIIRAMQEVFRSGTARSASDSFSKSLRLAGKTGTTNLLRDSWFAGFSGNYVTVVWVGRDDNEPAGVTGSQGALPVWTRVMRNLTLEPVIKTTPDRKKRKNVIVKKKRCVEKDEAGANRKKGDGKIRCKPEIKQATSSASVSAETKQTSGSVKGG